jgi:hypothetical protein
MANCEKLSSCAFFNETLPNMPITAQYLRNRYCLYNYLDCARYIVSQTLGKDKVPPDLFPEELTKAERIIAQHKSE